LPLVNDYQQVKEVYQDAAARGVGLPVFCAEDRETLEAILASALEVGKEIGVEDLPIIPAWTSRYPGRGQMTLLTACGDPVLGTRLMFSDLEAMTSGTSPYRKLRVLPHFDHAFPWLDGDIMEMFAENFASIMCDASEKPFEENMRITADFVQRMNKRVVIEGAVDEIFESGGAGEKNEPTTVAQAQKFLAATGVDIIVPNVGTEHRATADQVQYRAERACELSAALGKIMCLHGTSSVKPEDLSRLPDDGFVKINVYTTLAVHGGQALARRVLHDIGEIFTKDQVEEMIAQGLLGDKIIALGTTPKPKLAIVGNPLRRDAWFNAVKNRCKDFLNIFNYERFAK
jgi:fructose/tagatose bisphosphate aldolase